MFDFETNSVVKDISTVPEQFRPLFAEDTSEKGTFKLRMDDPALKGAIEGLVGSAKALKAERNLSKEYKGKAVDLTDLADFGKTPAEIKATFQAKYEDLQSQLADKSKTRVDLDRIKAELKDAHAKEKVALEERVKSRTSQLEKLLVDNAIRQAIGDQAVDADLLMPFVKERVRAVEVGGEYRARVIDETGAERHSPASGQEMSILELVKEMESSTKFAPLFKSKSKSGSGAAPGAAASRSFGPAQSMSSVDKIARGLNKHGI
jgi:hypothetical protein